MDKEIKKPEIEASEDFLEIKHGNMFLKVPNNLHYVTLAKNFLVTFEELLKEIPTIPLIIKKDDEDEVSQEIEVDSVDNKELIDVKVVDMADVSLEIPEPPEEKEEGIPDKCPKCSAKVKTSRVRTRENLMFQVVKCKKNWLFGNCDFKKEYAFKI